MFFVVITRKSLSQNSAITWRQTPQGVHSFSKSPSLPPTTAIAMNSFSPSLIALKKATRSAQTVGVKDEFSILQPVYILKYCHFCSKSCSTRNRNRRIRILRTFFASLSKRYFNHVHLFADSIHYVPSFSYF